MIFYKSKDTASNKLSNTEKTALNVLGKMVQAGDDIIQTLFYAQKDRKDKEAYDRKYKITDHKDFANFLAKNYPMKLAIDYEKHSKLAFEAFSLLELNHGNGITDIMNQEDFVQFRKNIVPKFIKYINKNNLLKKPAFEQNTADEILLALIKKQGQALLEIGKARKTTMAKRYLAFAKAFQEYDNSENQK